MDEEQRDDLVANAAAEAGRLAQVVGALEEMLERARDERALVHDWTEGQLETLRRALRAPRFGDVEGLAAEHEAARTELAAVQELRRRLSARS